MIIMRSADIKKKENVQMANIMESFDKRLSRRKENLSPQSKKTPYNHCLKRFREGGECVDELPLAAVRGGGPFPQVTVNGNL